MDSVWEVGGGGGAARRGILKSHHTVEMWMAFQLTCKSSPFTKNSADFECCIAEGSAHNSKRAKTCTIQSHRKGILLPVVTVCTANILSSAMTDREKDPLTIDEPIRWKTPEGKKGKKKLGRVTPDQRGALHRLTAAPSL